jgi:phosphomannomutase
MADSVKFGTSGVRGLVVDLTDEVCARYTGAFVSRMRELGEFDRQPALLLGIDLRASSPPIAQACAGAAGVAGIAVIDCGALPTPALALEAMRRGLPAIMVTGSHIPADRNGLKFYRADGEIDKADEAAILAGLGSANQLGTPAPKVTAAADALERYAARYCALGAAISLAGMRIGVYQHSSVARDLMVEVLETLGAEVVRLGWSADFVPVDTEALRPEDVKLVAEWSAEQGLDAIVSTDGDADRPLIADETGVFLRGDVVGMLTSEFLGAATVVTPVTSTSAVEQSGLFGTVVRTRVGSPHVIAGMAGKPDGVVVGFEANGGVLLGSDARIGRVTLAALPTRDALLPIVAALGLARRQGLSLSGLVGGLPQRRTASAVIRNTPSELSGPFLMRLAADTDYARILLAELGQISDKNAMDGVKMTLASGSTVHFRASGNAPELRCYTEAGSRADAEALLALALEKARKELAAQSAHTL